MKIRNVIQSVVLFLLSLCLTSCTTPIIKDNPEINTNFTVSKLTDDDFNGVGTIGSRTKEDFRKVYLSFNIKKSRYLSDRTISIPNLRNIMNSYDLERYWYGESTRWDNPTEDAVYTYDIMFLSKNLTDEDIKLIFKDSLIVITSINVIAWFFIAI